MKTISLKYKAVLAVVFTVILCTCILMITAKETKGAEVIASGTCGENVTWSLDEEGTLIISGNGSMADYSSGNNSPWSSFLNSIKTVEIDSGVTKIGKNAFDGCSNLESIDIPLSVTSIGDQAFRFCENLESIALPQGLISIGEYAFQQCTNLQSVVFPDTLTSMGSSAFYNCTSLTSITLPSSLSSIPNYAFEKCSGLTQVIIPEGVSSIGNSAFRTCSNLTNITIPKSVTSVGDAAVGFEQGDKISGFIIYGYTDSAAQNYATTYEFDFVALDAPADYTAVEEAITEGSALDENLYSKESFASLTAAVEAVEYGKLATEQAEVDAMAQAINKAIEDLIEVYTYKIIDSISVRITGYIGSDTEITIPKVINKHRVTTIDGSVFRERTDLTSITIPEGVTSLAYRSFYNCSNLKSITLPNSLTFMDSEVFSGCSSLESIVLPDKITAIGYMWFYQCISLTSITIPERVTSIEDMAFYNCSSLKSIMIPENVTSIGYGTFSGCSSLTSITFPEGLTSIGDGAFWGCSSLTSITFPEGLTSIGINAFGKCSKLVNIIVPDGVTSIGNSAFMDCSSLASITIPEGVTSIETSTFERCSSLTSITLPEGVTSIGDYAFYDCGSLTSVTIPNSVTSIGDKAFLGCSSLMSITLPDSLTSIGNAAFYNCSSLTSIIIPEGVDSIGNQVFSNCSRLTSTNLPEGINCIGYEMFWQCGELTDIAIPDGVTEIGIRAFSGCSSIKSIAIPESVTSIGEGAFAGCSGLTRITIPEGVTSIENEAFKGCKNIRIIAIPDGVTSIGMNAFASCENLASITIPEGVTSIGERAFYMCDRLSSITIPLSVGKIGPSAFEWINKDYIVYTVPKSYASRRFEASHLQYLYEDESEPDNKDYLGFISDRIVMTPNGTAQLLDYLIFNHYNSDECTVTISDEDLFFYDGGTIAALAEGNANLTVSQGGLSATVRLIATNEVVGTTEIALEKTQLGLEKGKFTLLKFMLSPEDATDNRVIWASSDNTVATVNNGLITAIHPGRAMVTATLASNSDIKASCEVNVTNPLKAILTLEEAQPYTVRMGESKKIQFYLYPSDAENVHLSYSSSAPEIISIDETGKMTAHDEGTVQITISSGTVSRTVSVTAIIPLTGLSLDQNSVRTACGDSVRLTPIFEPQNATEQAVSWSSNKEEVATVDGNGVVTVHGRGIATITATAGDCSAECTIVCNTHTWDEGQITTAPTCTEEGVKTFTCICGEKYTEAVPATGHTIVRHAPTEAACTTEGSNEYWFCDVCRHYFADAEGNTEIEEGSWIIPALGHDMLLHEAVEATYEAEGNETYWECKRCKKFFSDEVGETEIAEGSWVTPKLIPDGWVTIAGETYYYKDRVAHKGWLKYEDRWYYMDSTTGAMQTGFVRIDSSTYYMSESGVMQTGWFEDNDIWYYANGSGVLQTGWLKSGTNWYYLDPTTGAMQTGFVTIGNSKYYMTASGAMMTGWIKDNETWYYANGSGAIQKGWVQSGPTWYYMDPSSGAMQTGWVTIGNTKYYMASSGAMLTGWVKDGGTWYYMSSSGVMAIGWVKDGNTWYYMKADGAMAANEWVTGYYWISASGAWTYQPVGSWKSNSTGWWFGDTSGWYAKNETLKINDVFYTFNAAGYWVQ